MAIDTGLLTDRLLQAGSTAASDIWGSIRTVAEPELKKIALQIAALADPGSPWSEEEAKLLFQMQVRSAITIIVAMTSLVLLAVQKAINAILSAVSDFVNGAIGFPLI